MRFFQLFAIRIVDFSTILLFVKRITAKIGSIAVYSFFRSFYKKFLILCLSPFHLPIFRRLYPLFYGGRI